MAVYVNLNERATQRLATLSKITNRPQTSIANEAIDHYIEDLEKKYLGKTPEEYSDNN